MADAARRDALLQALRQNPEDAALRLVFADWLEEHATEVNGIEKYAADLRHAVLGAASVLVFARVGSGTLKELLSCLDTARALLRGVEVPMLKDYLDRLLPFLNERPEDLV